MNNISVDIAIIINSYNRFALLQECLQALERWVIHSEFKDRCAVVIYEAGSSDGSIEWLQNNAQELSFPIKLILPKATEDTSFAAGLNKGVIHAEIQFPNLKYLLFYETDNQILSKNPLTNALFQLELQKNLGACGFTVRQINGKPAGIGQPFPTLFNFAIGKNLVHRFQLEAIPYQWMKGINGVEFSEVDVVYTSPLVVKLVAWKESGGLDSERFPFSDCDIDWARRLRNLGWRMGVVRSNDVIHDNQDALSTWSKSRAIQNNRGRLRYFQRHRPIGIYIVWPFPLMLRHLIELISVKLTVKDPERRLKLSKQFLELLKSCFRKYEST
ncbi:glycosyltransferase family 2 protein [Hymenobacter sp. RP-2-7]|uniref:Glycosyltransferase family 2 protein n=1 Tax=Hymenobacter polaris TaxID=2682546 RepID=A0A7Y0AAA7_9BACT|nr:glycosyltransferase [Hymenobacter polaris]NML63648.1 glycosyltransferase family 2 protein [Hymenobacter polaris]